MANLRMPDLNRIVQFVGLEHLAQSGIYFLMHDEIVVYVGQARNMRRRVGEHLVEGLKTFNAVAHVPCPAHKLDGLERRYIQKLLPKYNNTYAKLMKQAGVESTNGGRLVAKTKVVRIANTNIRRAIKSLA